MAASLQEEFPILSRTEEASESEDGEKEPDLFPLCVELEKDEVVLMATIKPARTTGSTNPVLHLVSCLYSTFLSTYNGESTTADTKANTIAIPL